jgi:hypothetical protein
MKTITWIFLGWIALLASAQADTESTKENPMANRQMTTNELEARGKQLRESIDARYQELSEPAGALSSQKPMIEVVITDLFTPFIPIGMSFDDAEVILRAAGFRISPSKLMAVNDGYYPGFVANFDYARDMNWFITVSYSIDTDTPNGRKVASGGGIILKQRH